MREKESPDAVKRVKERKECCRRQQQTYRAIKTKVKKDVVDIVLSLICE